MHKVLIRKCIFESHRTHLIVINARLDSLEPPSMISSILLYFEGEKDSERVIVDSPGS